MRFFSFFLALFLFFSCSQYREYQKVIKSTDVDLKYNKAFEYYNTQDYVRALQLFEDLLPYFKGDSKAEELYYKYIYCNYFVEDYISTAYHAKNFTSKFMLSLKNEEMAFLSAYCYYLDSPRSSLDQQNTYKAINELESFLMNYPGSDSVKTINNLIFNLNEKLQKKYFEIVTSYYNRGRFKSAIHAIESYIVEFPETIFLEEVKFTQLKAYYELGKNSIDQKKEQRIKEAIFACDDFLITFPNGSFNEEVMSIYQKLKYIENGL